MHMVFGVIEVLTVLDVLTSQIWSYNFYPSNLGIKFPYPYQYSDGENYVKPFFYGDDGPDSNAESKSDRIFYSQGNNYLSGRTTIQEKVLDIILKFFKSNDQLMSGEAERILGTERDVMDVSNAPFFNLAEYKFNSPGEQVTNENSFGRRNFQDFGWNWKKAWHRFSYLATQLYRDDKEQETSSSFSSAYSDVHAKSENDEELQYVPTFIPIQKNDYEFNKHGSQPNSSAILTNENEQYIQMKFDDFEQLIKPFQNQEDSLLFSSKYPTTPPRYESKDQHDLNLHAGANSRSILFKPTTGNADNSIRNIRMHLSSHQKRVQNDLNIINEIPTAEDDAMKDFDLQDKPYFRFKPSLSPSAYSPIFQDYDAELRDKNLDESFVGGEADSFPLEYEMEDVNFPSDEKSIFDTLHSSSVFRKNSRKPDQYVASNSLEFVTDIFPLEHQMKDEKFPSKEKNFFDRLHTDLQDKSYFRFKPSLSPSAYSPIFQDYTADELIDKNLYDPFVGRKADSFPLEYRMKDENFPSNEKNIFDRLHGSSAFRASSQKQNQDVLSNSLEFVTDIFPLEYQMKDENFPSNEKNIFDRLHNSSPIRENSMKPDQSVASNSLDFVTDEFQQEFGKYSPTEENRHGDNKRFLSSANLSEEIKLIFLKSILKLVQTSSGVLKEWNTSENIETFKNIIHESIYRPAVPSFKNKLTLQDSPTKNWDSFTEDGHPFTEESEVFFEDKPSSDSSEFSPTDQGNDPLRKEELRAEAYVPPVPAYFLEQIRFLEVEEPDYLLQKNSYYFNSTEIVNFNRGTVIDALTSLAFSVVEDLSFVRINSTAFDEMIAFILSDINEKPQPVTTSEAEEIMYTTDVTGIKGITEYSLIEGSKITDENDRKFLQDLKEFSQRKKHPKRANTEEIYTPKI